MEVLGVGLGDAPALSVEAGGGLFPCGLGEDGPGARAHGREGCLVEGLGVKFTDPAAGSAQEVAQALGPGVAVGVLDELQVAQLVGTAQGDSHFSLRGPCVRSRTAFLERTAVYRCLTTRGAPPIICALYAAAISMFVRRKKPLGE